LRPRQLLAEFHHGLYGITKVQTQSALKKLNALDYRIFSISPTGREYSFLLLQVSPTGALNDRFV
jgi:hypothetical protein